MSNLDEVLGACQAASVPIVRPATTMGTGVRIAIVADPEGNLVEFLERG